MVGSKESSGDFSECLHKHDDSLYVLGSRISILPEEPVFISLDVLKESKLSILVGDEVIVGTLEFNGYGNKKNDFRNVNDYSYIFTFVNGYSVLLPVPENGSKDISFDIGSDKPCAEVLDEDVNLLLRSSHLSIVIQDGGVLIRNFSDEDDLFYDLTNSLKEEVDSDDSDEFVEVADSSISVIGENLNVVGTIKGSGDFCASTSRQIGGSLASCKYPFENEDALAVDVNRGIFAVCDGVGGSPRGEEASHLVANWIARSNVDLKTAIDYAYDALRFFDHVFNENGHPFPPDTVFVAAQVKGNVLDLAYIGDCQWVIVRDGNVYKSKPHSEIEAKIRRGDITERDSFVNKKFFFRRGELTRTFYGRFFLDDGDDDNVEFDTFDLRSDDFVFLISDGASDALTDEDFLDVVNGKFSLTEGMEYLKSLIFKRNNSGWFLRKFDDGGDSAYVGAPSDNVSIAIYRHK